VIYIFCFYLFLPTSIFLMYKLTGYHPDQDMQSFKPHAAPLSPLAGPRSPPLTGSGGSGKGRWSGRSRDNAIAQVIEHCLVS
jgi:hypothetical protein